MAKTASKASQQRCPICGTAQPIAARQCAVCGAALSSVPSSVPADSIERTQIRRPTAVTAPSQSSWMAHEIDLYEGALPSVPRSGLIVLAIVIILLIGGIVLIAGSINQSRQNTIASVPTRTATENPYATNTPHPTLTLLVVPPTLDLPTVTPTMPPPTVTPTRGPCIQKAAAGDTLSALAARCGEYSMDVIPTILFDNHMNDPAQLRAGQSVQIPWPTTTDQSPLVIAGNSNTTATAPSGYIEPTLPAGVTWYTVKANDDAISVAFRFHTTIKTIHDLNPEVASQFSQCDYGQPAGGSTCVVQLSIGQRLRVPAFTPTPTLSPVPNGSETATQSLTPTLNIPYLSSPGDNMLFGPNDYPVLRWGGTGTLGGGQAYLVTVLDTTINKSYTVATAANTFTLPIDWQPTDGTRHIYQWSIAIVNGANMSGASAITVTPNPGATSNPFATSSRTFTWQGP